MNSTIPSPETTSFPDFRFGVASSSFQTEGANHTYGKGSSIWDHFVRRKRILKKYSVYVRGSDFFNRYSHDLDLMEGMGISNFRLSISWPRIFPDGRGRINKSSIEHYKRIFEACNKRGIEPWVTLYHWDLPQELEEIGGWTNRDVVGWFSDYVYRCSKEFGDVISKWMVMNEPTVFTGAGYFLGVHAPGKKGLRNYLPAVHHVALSQAAGINILKQELPGAKVGTTVSCSLIQSESFKDNDILAARRIDALLNRLFYEPLIGLGYPTDDLPFLRKMDRFIRSEDISNLCAKPDFIGLQYYTREFVSSAWWVPFLKAKLVPAHKRRVFRTTMNWEVYPAGIFEMIKKYAAYDQTKEIIITENGAAFDDEISEVGISDKARIAFLKEHILQVMQAVRDGYPVSGYFVWSFTDNFEWAEGYRQRFGIVHVDYDTQKRTIKDSGKWYSEFIRNFDHTKNRMVQDEADKFIK
ncbi:MAG: GH1 family beta-glucosidase [Bacteroidota bacterium]